MTTMKIKIWRITEEENTPALVLVLVLVRAFFSLYPRSYRSQPFLTSDVIIKCWKWISFWELTFFLPPTSSLLLPSTPATAKIIYKKKKVQSLVQPTVLATSGLHKTDFSFAEPQDDQCAIAQSMILLHGQGQQVRFGSLYLNSH